MSDQHKSLKQIMAFRLEKLDTLRKAGVDPYPVKFNPSHSSESIKSNYDELEGQSVKIAGRIMAIRKMGKASFAQIMDREGKIQFFIRRDDVGDESYSYFKLLDIGDYVGIEGLVFTTKTGEISVHTAIITILAKSIRPLPVVKEKDGQVFDSFSDKEQRYRNRHLDLILNPEVKETFIKRASIIRSIREFLDAKGFLEVETPVFAGPFDLLLHLILQDEVDLYEVSLGAIIEAYLDEIQRMEGVNLAVATEFLLIAATLIELKSRRLLPDASDLDLEEELALWEERDLLLARLLECKTFKDASQALKALTIDASLSFPRLVGMEEQFLGLMPDLLEGVTPIAINEAYLRATAPKPQLDLFHVAPVKLTVAETVEFLIEELPSIGKTTLRNLTRSTVDRVEVVVYFIAVLDLYKQGIVNLTQIESFRDLTISWLGSDQGTEFADKNSYEG